MTDEKLVIYFHWPMGGREGCFMFIGSIFELLIYRNLLICYMSEYRVCSMIDDEG